MSHIVKNKDIEKQYKSRLSIADRLPWLEWSDAENIVLLEDMKSCGALLEIQDISTEAKPESMIEEVHKNVKGVFQSVVPLEDNDPWIVQIYIQDDLTLDPLYRRLEDYVKDKSDPLTKKYLEIMERHFKLLGREGGMFRDPLSDLNFRGRTRRIRLAVYRRYEDEKNSSAKKKVDVVNELKVVTETLITQLRQGGMNVRRLKGKHFYEWLVRWFNPNPELTNGDQDELLKAFPYPEDNKKPYGWNFCQNVFFDTVKDEEGAWVFDDIKHKVMVFQDLQDQLDIGVISRERSFGSGKNRYALIDKFPPGTIYTIQLIFESKNAVQKHLNTIKKAAVGQELVIQEVKRNVERAFYEIANGNMLFRSSEAIFIRAATHEALEENERNLRALLVSSGLTTVKTEEELYPLDVYLRFLPFSFSYKFDKKHSFRSTYKYADDIARLLPVYGRSKGDGMNPLFVGYNRGGEPFIFDPTSSDFKQSNSHMFIPGTTGAGKSVTLNSLIVSLSAVSNPRIIAIEVGGSFDLTTKLLKAYGRDVRTLKFSRKEPIVLNPYAEAYKALTMVEKEEALLEQLAIKDSQDDAENFLEAKTKQLEKEIASLEKDSDESESIEDRDILAEMMLATRIMVTGGDDRENEKITRSDMMLIMQALIYTMKKCRDAGVPQMLVQHLAESFAKIADQTNNTIEQSRLREFSRNLSTYTLGMKAQFVNGQSEPLGEFDCLHVDFGFMQEESNRDLLNICCISLLSKVMAIAEAHKASFRPTFLVFDEIHIFLSSDIGIVYLVLLAKVARKFGVWLIFATQNINDFSGKARKILSMMETWICLSLDREEVAHIETFKPLTEEMKALLLSVQKFPGLYSEGVLIGKRYSGLFRNVPPRFMLALSMTEQHERAELAKIMQENNLTSELEAVEIMACKLEEKQAKEMKDDRTFLD